MKQKKLGLDKVKQVCDASNIGSIRTMEALGGTLERTEIDPYDGVLTSVYRLNVDKTIDKYKDIFENNAHINASIKL